MSHIYHTTDDLARMIYKSGIRVSAQRIAVLDFIANGKTHPTADEIYGKLHVAYPNISRTTIYNSLHVLTQSGLVKMLEIENGVMRYDMGRQAEHGHFLCKECGTVFDLPIPEDIHIPTDPGFVVDSMEFNCKGLCPKCRSAHEITTTDNISCQ